MIHTKNDILSELDAAEIHTVSKAVVDLILTGKDNTYQNAAHSSDSTTNDSKSYGSLTEVRNDYPNTEINETIGDYALYSVKFGSAYDRSVTMTYLAEEHGILIEVTKGNSSTASIYAQLESYKQFEGYENYFYQEMLNSADLDQKDTVFEIFYTTKTLNVHFYQTFGTEFAHLLITPEQAIEIIELLNIHNNTSYYESLLKY